jgi:hypothetical protein
MQTTITDNLGVERTTTVCDQCHKVVVPQSSSTTGYGINDNGEHICYACCGENDHRDLYGLPVGKRTILYDCGEALTNWPGTFSVFPHHRKVGRHNIAGKRCDMWFYLDGPQGEHFYHGVRYGDETQVVHVRRLKEV